MDLYFEEACCWLAVWASLLPAECALKTNPGADSEGAKSRPLFLDTFVFLPNCALPGVAMDTILPHTHKNISAYLLSAEQGLCHVSGFVCAHAWHNGQCWMKSCCAKSLQGEAPCGSAVHGRVDEMSPAPSPHQTPLPQTPLDPPPLADSMTGGRQGGQGRIWWTRKYWWHYRCRKGLRTAIVLSTASCLFLQWKYTANNGSSFCIKIHIILWNFKLFWEALFWEDLPMISQLGRHAHGMTSQKGCVECGKPLQWESAGQDWMDIWTEI